jgi:hypothetical protein
MLTQNEQLVQENVFLRQQLNLLMDWYFGRSEGFQSRANPKLWIEVNKKVRKLDEEKTLREHEDVNAVEH